MVTNNFNKVVREAFPCLLSAAGCCYLPTGCTASRSSAPAPTAPGPTAGLLLAAAAWLPKQCINVSLSSKHRRSTTLSFLVTSAAFLDSQRYWINSSCSARMLLALTHFSKSPRAQSCPRSSRLSTLHSPAMIESLIFLREQIAEINKKSSTRTTKHFISTAIRGGATEVSPMSDTGYSTVTVQDTLNHKYCHMDLR